MREHCKVRAAIEKPAHIDTAATSFLESKQGECANRLPINELDASTVRDIAATGILMLLSVRMNPFWPFEAFDCVFLGANVSIHEITILLNLRLQCYERILRPVEGHTGYCHQNGCKRQEGPLQPL